MDIQVSIPIVGNNKVINRNILYSDRELLSEEMGDNLRMTCISNVSEYTLERCLKLILESNKNIVFNTICYSKKDRKVYFYTDGELSVNEWENSENKIYNSLNNTMEILCEVRDVLIRRNCKREDCVSLYDVLSLIKMKYNSLNDIIKHYNSIINEIISNNYEGAIINNYGFDYDKNELCLGFCFYNDIELGNDFEEIRFKKNENGLYLVNYESSYGNDLLSVLKEQLSEFYDKYMEYSDYKKQYSTDKNTINSNFKIDIIPSGIELYSDIICDNNEYFNLSFFVNYANNYVIDCSSLDVIDMIIGNEEEIFKNIFIKIDDCPEWSRDILYENRQKQLYEEKRKVLRKEKRLALIRRVFPNIFK